MHTKRINELIARKLSGEASLLELEELQLLLIQYPEEQYFLELMTDWWDSSKTSTNTNEQEADVHFQYVINQTANVEAALPNNISTHFSGKTIWLWRAAAAALVLCIVGWYFWLATESPTQHQAPKNEIVAQRGTKSKVLLPDGTQVWLNADSRLTYTNTVNDTIREVTLEGEAFFDVVKDAHRPFIVHTSEIDIRVLGTAFNVKSYPQDATIEATLVRGLIEVKKNNQPQSSKIILRPNEKLVYQKLTVPANKATSDTENSINTETIAAGISISALPKNIMDSARIETSWVFGKLLFEGDRFNELAPKMERWFNVRIHFKNESLSAIRFRGVFENENIEEALQALQLIAPFTYVMKDNEVWIDKK